jgi:hypothetical protein
MTKIRAGIEIPIIPEDFIDSKEELSLEMLETFLEQTYRYVQSGLDKADGGIAKTDIDQYPER